VCRENLRAWRRIAPPTRQFISHYKYMIIIETKTFKVFGLIRPTNVVFQAANAALALRIRRYSQLSSLRYFMNISN
jgi:hypothetical protein